MINSFSLSFNEIFRKYLLNTLKTIMSMSFSAEQNLETFLILSMFSTQKENKDMQKSKKVKGINFNSRQK